MSKKRKRLPQHTGIGEIVFSTDNATYKQLREKVIRVFYNSINFKSFQRKIINY